MKGKRRENGHWWLTDGSGEELGKVAAWHDIVEVLLGAARDIAVRGQGGDRGELGAAVGSVASQGEDEDASGLGVFGAARSRRDARGRGSSARGCSGLEAEAWPWRRDEVGGSGGVRAGVVDEDALWGAALAARARREDEATTEARGGVDVARGGVEWTGGGAGADVVANGAGSRWWLGVETEA